MERHLESLLGRNHPSRTQVEVQNLAEISGGWETSVFSFDLVYLQSNATVTEPLVLKIHPGPLGGSQAAREFNVMRAVSDHGIRVPAVVLHVDDAVGFGGSILVMERVVGPHLRSLVMAAPDLISEMAGQLARLHRIPVEDVFEEAPGARDGFVTADPTAMKAAVDRFGLTEFRGLLQWLDETSVATVAPSVNHNDFHPENIKVGEGGDLVTIDWSHAGIGDFRTDLAWSAFWTGEMAGVRARSDLVTAYGEASGNRIGDLEFFEAMTLGARLLTIATWLEGSVEPPVPKITREAIMGDYKPTVLSVRDRVGEITGVRMPLMELS